MRLRPFGLAFVLIGAASGGCATTDIDAEGSQAVEVGAPTPNITSFVLTVNADEADIVVTTTNSTSTCPAFSICNFAYIGGTSLTIKTKAQILIDCEKFVRWDGACSGQTNTCSLVINSALSTTAVYGPIPGCVPP